MPDPSRPAAGLLFLHAQTPLHPGSGTALGAVDLPVQRERHTQYPLIPGSALKGVLRDLCREQAKGEYDNDRRQADLQHANLTAAFGPATGDAREGSAYSGALSLTDARLLAFPVRSLRGVFAWVTCPQVLQRLGNDLKLAGATGAPAAGKIDDGHALFDPDGPLAIDRKALVLEEFDFAFGGQEAASEWVAKNAVDAETGKRLRSRFAVVGDDDFVHFARHATEVTARIGLNYETKTVKDGALFYQEFLPAETLFYSVVLANASRKEKVAREADAMLGYLGAALKERKVLQVGGDETTGKGYCFARLTDGKGGDL